MVDAVRGPGDLDVWLVLFLEVRGCKTRRSLAPC
jgi:hypothetical protein